MDARILARARRRPPADLARRAPRRGSSCRAAGHAAARLRRRGSQASCVAGRGCRGAGVSLAGGRLRRIVSRVSCGEHSREAAHPSTDGGGSHLRRDVAGRQGRPHRRTVRQAPFLANRDDRRGRASIVLRSSDQRRHAHRRSADAGPGAHGPGLPPVGCDAQPAAGLHQGRLRRHQPRSRVESGVRRQLGRGDALRGAGSRDRARTSLHGCVRDRSRSRAAAPSDRRLDEPRGPRARLRGGPFAHRLAERRVVRLLRAYAVDRRAYAANSTAHTSSSFAASRTRSVARSGRPPRSPTSSGSARPSIPTRFLAGSR